jgi:hypothetical protein
MGCLEGSGVPVLYIGQKTKIHHDQLHSIFNITAGDMYSYRSAYSSGYSDKNLVFVYKET